MALTHLGDVGVLGMLMSDIPFIIVFLNTNLNMFVFRGKAKVQIQQHWTCLGCGWWVLFIGLLAGHHDHDHDDGDDDEDDVNISVI